MKKTFTILFVIGYIIESNGQTCNAIDLNFGVAGRGIGISEANYHISKNIFVQSDNKIIQVSGGNVGTGSYHFKVVRYKEGGSLDSSFGQNGKVVTALGQTDDVTSAALQNDGKIVVAGTIYSPSYYSDMGIVRYNSNGSLDNSFGVGGKVLISFAATNDRANGLAIQPDGKIVLVGSIEGNCTTACWGTWFCSPAFAVMRFNSNGSLDNSFGQNGKVLTNVGLLNAGSAFSTVVQTDGKIVVAGQSLYDFGCDYYGGGTYYSSAFTMVRYNANGSIDNSFGSNGIVSDSLNLIDVSKMSLTSTGKIIVMGYDRNGGIAVKQYNSDGSLDNSFGQQGKVKFDGSLSSLLITPNGKIVLAGSIHVDPADNFQIIRLNGDGSYDSSFNATGKVFIHLGQPGSRDIATGVALQGDHLIAGGTSYYQSISSVLVVRLLDTLRGLPIVITPRNTLTPCNGESATLVASETGTMQWFRNGQLINGANDTVYTTFNNGQYSVQVQNSKGCGQSAQVTVAINGLPVTVTATGPLNFCDGDSVRLVSSEKGSLQWYKNGVLINGATDTVYTAKVSGTYTVSVKNTKGCGTSAAAFVTVNQAKPGIIWEGVPSRLSTVQGYYSYQWYLNGNVIVGANASFFQPVQTGSYKVSIADYNCSTTSDEFNLDCNVAAIPKPLITWNGTQLSTFSGYSQYQWYLNGNAIAGAYSSFFQPVQAGIYKVTITNSINCSSTSDEFSLSCNAFGPPKPLISWTSSYYLATAPGYSQYQWYLNGTAIVGANASFFQPVQTGLYKVTITYHDCTTTSDEFNLTCNVVAVPKPPITWNGTQLSTSSGSGQYQWYLNGNAIAGANSSFFQPVQVGVYKVTVTNTLNCSNTSDDFDISCTVFGPPKPPIDWTNSYYFSTTPGYAHYQWLLNGNAIAGNDSSNYKPAASGLYAVTVTNTAGCSSTSDNFNLVVLGIAGINVGDSKLRFYPNPARTVLNVEIANAGSRKLEAELYDLPGRLVQKQMLNQRNNQLSVQRLPAGLYQLVIMNGAQRTVVKVLVVK